MASTSFDDLLKDTDTAFYTFAGAVFDKKPEAFSETERASLRRIWDFHTKSPDEIEAMPADEQNILNDLRLAKLLDDNVRTMREVDAMMKLRV